MTRLTRLLILAGVFSGSAVVGSCGARSGDRLEGQRMGADSASVPADGRTAMARPDSQMAAVLDQLAALNGKPIEQLSAEEARRQPTPADAVKALLVKRGQPVVPEAVGEVMDRTIPGPGGAIPIRIYTPAGSGPLPVVVYYHGGGFVIATIDTYDGSARALANAAKAIVVSVEYRKAPEHRFPAAHEDAFAAYQWVVSNASTLKGDSTRVAVVGESAGGNLAASVSLTARKEGIRMPVYQVLVYPVAGTDVSTPSYLENANAKPLNKATMQWFFEQYAGSSRDTLDPRLVPLRASLEGMPPTTLITAEIDPLRSEGKLLAERLESAGVRVDYRNYEGMAHEFFGMGAVVDKANEAVAQAAAGLRLGFGASRASNP